MDTREPWELKVSIICQAAASYLRWLDAPEHQRLFGDCNGVLEKARRLIPEAIQRANETVAVDGDWDTGCVVAVPQEKLERLQEMGLCRNLVSSSQSA